MFSISRNTIGELITVLQNLPGNSSYQNPLGSLSGASIGQHTRHIIEMYQSLLNGYDGGLINYDKRKRDLELETNREVAIDALLFINSKIEQPDKQITLAYELNESPYSITSNYLREVCYNLEHCIHHQALIKVGLLSMNIATASEHFGVAPSTIQYRKQCVQ